MSAPGHSDDNSFTREDDGTPPKSPRRKSQFSLGSSGSSSHLALPEMSQSGKSSHSRRRSYISRLIRGSSEPREPGESVYDDLSEVSSGSSASQLFLKTRDLVKGFDKMAISTRSNASDIMSNLGSLLDRGSNSQGPKEPTTDLMVSKSRTLEAILEGALGASDQLQPLFDKHRDAIKRDMVAQNLLKQYANIRTLNHQMFTTIAICGSNGTGKSSLINALLDIDCITPTSNNAPCTAIPIEFRTRDRGQKMRKNFTVVADILTDEEWLPLATRLLEDLDEDLPGPEYEAASNTLGNLFNLTNEDTPITLDDINRIPPSCKEYAKFETQELLHLQVHVKKLNTDFWPVLKKITIYMDSPVLSTGVILIDLPGLGNINPMKVGIVDGYLRTSDAVFIVSNISQAVNDKNILLSATAVEPIARRIQLDASVNVSFILTQIDNISADSTNWNKKRAIQERITNIGHQIQTSLRSRKPDVEVFCVSSLEYQWNRNRLKDPNTIPCLSVDDSGVPSLRGYIQQRGLQQRELAVKNLVQGDMMSFWNSLQYWCNESSDSVLLEQQEPVAFKVRAECFDELNKSISRYTIAPFLEPLDIFIETLEADGRINDKLIMDAAKEAHAQAKTWNKLAWNSLRAACEREGDCILKTNQITIDWNRDLAIPLTNRVNKIWGMQLALLDLPLVFRDIAKTLCQTITDSIQDIAPEAQINKISISIQVNKVVGEQKKEWKTMLGDIDSIFAERRVQSLIKERLAGPIYGPCAKISGLGAKKNILKIVDDMLPGLIRDQYMEICDEIYQIPEKLRTLVGNTWSALVGVSDSILSTYKARHAYPVEKNTTVDIVDLNSVKSEFLGLAIGKFMAELKHQADRPRTTGISP